MNRTRFVSLTALALISIPCFAQAAAEKKVIAVEIGKHNTALLPRGKEADGIIGDFVLKNDRIHVLISGAQPLRRANMRTENAFVTQGCIYDMDLVDANNDQITVFRPGAAGGEVSWVRVVESAAPAGVIESVRTAAKGGGLYTRHEYRLEAGWQHILVTSTYKNESQKAVTIHPGAEWRGFEDSREWTAGKTHVADSTDPFDKRAYAWGLMPADVPAQDVVSLAPGEQKIIRTILAVADSPLSAYGEVKRVTEKTGIVSGSVLGPKGDAATHGSLLVTVEGTELASYPDVKGTYRAALPVGSYTMRFQDLGREPLEKKITLTAGQSLQADFKVSSASAVRVRVKDEAGAGSPAKIQFIGVQGTATPNLGTPIRAHGSDHQYFTHDGQFVQQLPAGRYLVRATRGPEFNMEERNIEVANGQMVDVDFTLHRVVNTKGWVSADFHSHSTPSGDNYCATDDRITDLVAEQIEFAPATEHNRFFSWVPNIERLGLTRQIKSVTGIEFTSNDTHMNGFPFTMDPNTQDNGAPMYDPDVRITAMRLRGWVTPSLKPGGSRYDTYQNSRARVLPSEPTDRWIQINHPSVGAMFFDRNHDGIEDGGVPGLEKLFDGAEVWSTDILTLNPMLKRNPRGQETARNTPNRTFGWLQLLNQGRHIWTVAVSDAHGVFQSGVGAWRMYLPSSTDDPEKIDAQEMVRNAKAGRMMLTNGPFLEVQTADGHPIGSTISASNGVDLKIRVQVPNWMDVNRIQILVSGRQPKEYNFTAQNHPEMFHQGTVRFDQQVHIALQHDEHLIVVATGEGTDLSKGWGRSMNSHMAPMAYTNPIYVDVDGNGFQANKDTLGFPLMTAAAGQE